MASRKRYAKYIKNIKTLPDFGWTEKHLAPKPGLILYQTIYELNGCTLRLNHGVFSVEKNGEVRKFHTTDNKTFAQFYQEMTDYALGIED
jgi:hypothetical protein